MGLALGNVYLDGFEIGARVRFGGRQMLAVHKLPGGTRIINSMGQDDDAIGWQGILSGSNAAVRARALDAMRVDGVAVPLSWDVFSAQVVISSLRLEYCNSWWIPYEIACTVVIGTQSPDSGTTPVDCLAAVLADLELAGGAPGVTSALSAVSSLDSFTPGNPAYAAAFSSLNNAGLSVGTALSNADVAMVNARDVASLVDASASLSSLAAASGYVGRATVNFVNAGF